MVTISNIDAIIFDLDGVLIDSRNAIMVAVKNTLGKMGLPFRGSMHEVLYKAHKKVFIDTYPEFKHMVDTFNELYVNNPANYEMLTILPNAKKVLEIISASGIKTGIATTKDRLRTMRILNELNHTFDHIVTGEDTKNTRPDPLPINLIIKKLHLNKEKTLYVGDTPLDIIQAKNAGLFSVAVSTGVYGANILKKENPDFMINDIYQLIEIIGIGK